MAGPTPPTPIHPAPQRLVDLDEAPAGADAELSTIHDTGLPPQGYRLRAASGNLTLHYADPAGLRYGIDTLSQVRTGSWLDQAAAEITDWPDFETRGYMLDISRDRVPSPAGLQRLVTALQTARYNQLELYTEHTFAYTGHEQVWQHASPLTAADIDWLAHLCASHGISLVPNQNCLGHMERWLRHDAYRPRAERPDGFTLSGETMPPTTLAPTADNAQFVTTLLNELVPLFHTRRVNIGCDEPWELGTGASRERAETEGLGRVYSGYVAAVMEPWIRRGYQVEYWADIAASHPHVLDQLPAESVPVVWMYNSPSMIRQILAHNDPAEEAVHAAHEIVLQDLVNGFRDRAAGLIERGRPFWVAPGTNAWRSMTGRLDEALRNLLDAAEVGLENQCSGFLVTHWTDQGAWDPPIISVPAIAAGGAISWAIGSNRDLDLAAVLNRHYFDDHTQVLGRALCEVGRIPEMLDRPVLNTTPLWVMLQNGGDLPAKHTPQAHRLAAARAVLVSAAFDLDVARPAAPLAQTAVEEVKLAIEAAVLAIDLIDAGMSADTDPDPETAATLMFRVEQLLAHHAACWLRSSRYGGLADSLAQLEPLRCRLQRLAAAHPGRAMPAGNPAGHPTPIGTDPRHSEGDI